ncbi:hypothetical protein J437_LFUL008304 [Ladona fulva]|uniref:Uncharacterized protein n=1 Tax=Ladona fulva TaxID=123851 RepID=A0A8K0K670_LADFU|nr:hypothetical protein J437_LFUL008304 [Ladona fulva]
MWRGDAGYSKKREPTLMMKKESGRPLFLMKFNFHIFSKLKEFLGGKIISDDEEVKEMVEKWLREVEREVLDTGMQNLVPRLQKCIDLKGRR